MARITIKIENDISELAESTFKLTFNEMYAKFGDNDEIRNIINRAEQYAIAENLNEEELVEYDETPEYDGSSKIDIINSDEKFI